jgi:cell division septum initiation protein DivIVA
MQMEAQVDVLLNIEREIAKVQAEYEAVFKKLAGLEKEQKEGLAILKKAADQVDAKGKVIIETRTGIVEFIAKINTSVPSVEQILKNPSDVKPGERAGDLLGRLLEQVDAEVAAKCVEIITQTKKDLTYSTQITQSLKVVAKTASIPDHITKQAGLAEVVVSVKDWLAGQASNLSKKILGVIGDVTMFFKTCLERTKMVQKAGKDVQSILSSASSQAEKIVSSGGKMASRNHRWLIEE